MAVTWRIAGRYLEACNCDAICPCRMIDGVPGGRSTYGVCFGALSWRVDEDELAGAKAVLTFKYDDDEPGSPWTLVLYVDGHAALGEILLGRMGGDVLRLPWIRKPSTVVAVRQAVIEIDDGLVRVGDAVALRAVTPVATDQTVACVIPGYERAGRELYADELVVAGEPFEFELHGRCAYESTFDYSG